MDSARDHGASRVHLEVREGNPAVIMYRGAGFSVAGRRRNYYRGRFGGEFDALFLGKFALPQLELLDALVDDGWIVPPDLLPRYACAPDFHTRLDACRRTPVERLYQTHRPPEHCA